MRTTNAMILSAAELLSMLRDAMPARYGTLLPSEELRAQLAVTSGGKLLIWFDDKPTVNTRRQA